MKQLRLMSGGAAQGLVGALRESFEREHACTVNGTFGAVGLMRDHLLAGEPSDLMILSQTLIDQLTKEG
ncbi:MAG: substrate-binding domain-containing protein, partial [Limnohabitans sp.]